LGERITEFAAKDAENAKRMDAIRWLGNHASHAEEDKLNAFLDRMTEARRNLARFPELGLESERLPVPGSRRLVIGDYLLDYEVIGGL